ncbi:MAG: alpha/beta hydrolase [Acidimicrobiales bacterium]
MNIEERLDADHLAVLGMLPEGFLEFSDIGATRALLGQMAEQAPAVPLPDSIIVEDHPVTGFDGHELFVRVYRPQLVRESSPAVLWMHAGGMVLGDVAMSDNWCAEIADQLGVVVGSVEYRLAPEFPFPVPMEDCYSALVWMADHADELNIDLARLAVAGASAGGGLATGLALLTRDRQGPAICFQLLTYPMLDDRNETPSSHAISDLRVWNRTANLVSWDAYLEGHAGADDVSIYASPARAEDLSGLPPAAITVGDLDMFLDEAITYAQRLLQAGVPTELHVYAGGFHGTNTFVAHGDLGQRWIRDELSALDRALNG